MNRIKVLIEIDEKDYKRLIRGYVDFITLPKEIFINGTPLPKGHGRLKDVDDGLKNCIETYEIKYWDEEVPTIIEADKEYDS